MVADLSPATLTFAGGLALGAAFGALGQRSRFCLIAAVSNYALIRDSRQLQAWIAALAVALAGAQALDASGLVALGESGYRRGGLDWLGAILGGLLFGVGGALAGGCAGRTLVNAASGGLGALAALAAFAASAWAAHFGFLEPWRGKLSAASQVPLADISAAALLGVPAPALAAVVALTGAVAILLLRPRREMLAVGAAVGLLVAAGWAVTGAAAGASLGELRPESLTYSGPLARVLALAFGQTLAGAGFGTALVAGTLLGALMAALVSGELRWTRPAPGRWGWYLGGGAMMGVGATLAGGCNIGIGLTGASTLSLNAWLALAAIVAGIRLGLAWLAKS
ncbi:MAG TPA: YeeE/YedE thiosulfate transporter family protein [Burkholderiales bacterium]|nr:YeeE/YedE thiosulfate transporter family protein [Burkholderiales bacterium]